MTPCAHHDGIPAFYHLVALDQVASTNDEALGLAAGGAGEGTLVTARRQTAGRGRRGRTWQSDEGNLFLSLVLKPPGGLRSAAAIGFAGALAIADAIDRLMGPGAMSPRKGRDAMSPRKGRDAMSPRKGRDAMSPQNGRDATALPRIALKWPNDVLIRDRKVSGLLIERAGGAADDAFVLGVGINLVSHPDDTRYPATDLSAEGAGEVSVSKALQVFCTAFLRRYGGWREEGFGPLRDAWLARARGIGENLSVEIEGRRFDGVFSTIDETGALCLDLGTAGVKKVTAGDVFFHAAPGKSSC